MRPKAEGGEEEFASFVEFHPYLLRQHEDKPLLEFPTFDRAIDEFFSKLASYAFWLIEFILGGSYACRESFHMFTFRAFFMTQPACPYSFCQSKARYSLNIFQKNLTLQADVLPSTCTRQSTEEVF